MSHFPVITSLQNPRIKAAAKLLADARERRRSGLFAMEGARELERALHCGYELVEVFSAPAYLSLPAQALIKGEILRQKVPCYEVSPAVFDKLVIREGKDGLVAVLRQKSYTLETLQSLRPSLVLAIEGLEKPGNIGALLRSADGAGVEAVVSLSPHSDPYNPHVIRASLGTVFRIPVISLSNAEFYDFCQEAGLQLLAAALHDRAQPYTTADCTKPTAILLGSEANGLSPFWIEHAHKLVTIPMLGMADSLNVSACGAVLLYEARRQRQV